MATPQRVWRAVEPYYSDDAVTIYHGRWEDVMPTLDVAVDLVVTDPPYCQNYKSNRGQDHRAIEGDDGTFDLPGMLDAVARVLRRGRHLYLFGPGSVEGSRFTAAVELVWDKQIIGTGDLTLPWGKSHEPITFAVYEPSKANRDKGYGRLAARMRKGSVISCQRTQGGATSRHPTEKPVDLLRELIESSSCMGETVLDPCMGVGSTLVAAVAEGRKAVGIEMDERYCETAVARMKEER